MGQTLAKPVTGVETKNRSEKADMLDNLGGWARPPIRRGDSMDAQCQWLQGNVALMGDMIKDVLVQDFDKGRVQMQIETIRALRAKLQKMKLESRDGWAGNHKLWALEDRLEEEQQKLIGLQRQQLDLDNERQKRLDEPGYKATEFVSGRQVDTRRRRTANGSGSEDGSLSDETESVASTAVGSLRSQSYTSQMGAPPRMRKRLMAHSGGAGMGKPKEEELMSEARGIIAGTPASSRSALQGRRKKKPEVVEEEDDHSRKGFFAPGGGFVHGMVFALGGPSTKLALLDPAKPAYYGFPKKTPQWRVNVMKAKRKFIMYMYVVSAFKKAAREGRRRAGINMVDRLDRMGSLGIFVPLVLDDFTDRFIEQQTQFSGVLEEETKAEEAEAKPKEGEEVEAEDGDAAGPSEALLHTPEARKGGRVSPTSVMSPGNQSSPNISDDGDGRGLAPRPAGAELWPQKKPSRLQIPIPNKKSGPPPRHGSKNLSPAASPTGLSPGVSPGRPSPVPPAPGRKGPLTPSGHHGRPLTPTRAQLGRPSTVLSGPRRRSAGGMEEPYRPSTSAVPSRIAGRRISHDNMTKADLSLKHLSREERMARVKARSDGSMARAKDRMESGRSKRAVADAGGGRMNHATGLAGRLLDHTETKDRLRKNGLVGDKSSFLNKGKFLPADGPHDFPNPNQPVRSDEDLQRAKQLMTTYVNRANSRWTDDFTWDFPQMFDISQFEKLGGLDFQHYKSEIEEMLTKGQLAVQFHAAEQTVELSDGSEELLWLADSWLVMDEIVPTKCPPGDRFEGLSFGGRSLLQLLLSVEAIAGRQGSYCIPVVIHVPDKYIAAVAKELHDCKYFGLNRDRIVLLAQPANKGYFFDDEDGQFKKAPLSQERPNGTGYSMKQLMWNFEASRIKEDGSREVMRKSVMSWLKDLGVTWLNSVQLDDLQRISRDGCIDVGALAMTLKMFKTNGWEMSLQASETADLNIARAAGGIIMSAEGEGWQNVEVESKSIKLAQAINPTPSPGKRKSRSAVARQVKVEDIQSPKWTVIIEQLQRKNGGKVIMPSNRFFFNLPALDKLLARKELFHTNLRLDGCYVYPNLHMSDITTAPDARCIALVPKKAISTAILASAPADWCEQAVPQMKEQDMDPRLKKAVGKYCSQHVVLRQKKADMMMLKKSMKGKNFVLFVNDTRSSRVAFQFLLGLVGSTVQAADTLHIMASVNTESAHAKAEDFIKTFDDPMLRFLQVERTVATRGYDTLVEQMHKFSEENKADLVVMGSDLVREEKTTQEKLKQASGGATANSLGSITLSATKHLLRPVLIVKSTSKCTIGRSNGVSEKVKVVLQVEPTVQPTIRYVASLLDPGRQDVIHLAKPNGIDAEGNETMATRMMLTHFADAVHKHRLNVGKRPVEGHFQESLPALAYRERSHIIAVQAPQTRQMTTELRDMIRASPCAVLINKTKEANEIESSL